MFHNTTPDLQDQDPRPQCTRPRPIFLVSDRSCRKTDVSDHITVICACRLFFRLFLLLCRGFLLKSWWRVEHFLHLPLSSAAFAASLMCSLARSLMSSDRYRVCPRRLLLLRINVYKNSMRRRNPSGQIYRADECTARSVLCACICTVMANDSAMSNPQGARKLGRASYIVSTAGIVVSIIIVAVVGSLHLGGNCPYTHHGICYQAKSDIPHAECEKIRGYFDDFSCFYDYWTDYAVATTTIRLRFDGHSTAYQRSLRSQWRNPLAAVTFDLFIYLGHSAAAHTQVGLRS